MSDLIDLQRNPDGSLTIRLTPPMADVFASAVLQAANQLQVQYAQPQIDIAPLSAPVRHAKPQSWPERAANQAA